VPNRCAAAALSCIALVGAFTAIAAAHAYVVVTSPAIDARLDASPDRVTVSFDEPVTIESREPLVVRDATGTVAPCFGRAYVNPDDVTQLVCRLASPLPVGAVHVTWRVTSADTHVVHGEFSFGIATAVHARSGETRSAYDPSGVMATFFRWLTLLGSLAIAGALGFATIVLRDDTAAPAAAALRARCEGLVRGGIIAAIVGSVGALDVQAAAATGTDGIRGLQHADEVLTGSVWGWMWLARIGALAVIALVARPLRGGLAGAALVVAGLLLATLSLSGHALVASGSIPPGVAVAADWIHLAAAALWLGGVFVFTLGLRGALTALPVPERDAFARTAIARFSTVAVAAVAAVLVTGVLGAVLHVPAPGALVTTFYGAVILAKALLLIPLLVLGYRNLRSGKPGSPNVDITATVTREAVVLVVVVTLSAVLTGLPLPHAPV